MWVLSKKWLCQPFSFSKLKKKKRIMRQGLFGPVRNENRCKTLHAMICNQEKRQDPVFVLERPDCAESFSYMQHCLGTGYSVSH